MASTTSRPGTPRSSPRGSRRGDRRVREATPDLHRRIGVQPSSALAFALDNGSHVVPNAVAAYGANRPNSRGEIGSGRGRLSLADKLANIVAERLRPVVDDVVYLAAATLVQRVGRRRRHVVDVHPRHDAVTGHRRERPPLRQSREQIGVRHSRPVENAVAQHDSLGVAVLTGRQHVLFHAPQRRDCRLTAWERRPGIRVGLVHQIRPRRRIPVREHHGLRDDASHSGPLCCRNEVARRPGSTASLPARSPWAASVPTSAGSSAVRRPPPARHRRPPCRFRRRRKRLPRRVWRPAARSGAASPVDWSDRPPRDRDVSTPAATESRTLVAPATSTRISDLPCFCNDGGAQRDCQDHRRRHQTTGLEPADQPPAPWCGSMM